MNPRKTQIALLLTVDLLLVAFMPIATFANPIGKDDGDNHLREKRHARNARNFQIDTNTVFESVFLPNNIAGHVTQNLVNFLASTTAWAILGSLTSLQGASQTRAIDQYDQQYTSFPPLSPISRSLESLSSEEKEALLKLAKEQPESFRNWFHQLYLEQKGQQLKA